MRKARRGSGEHRSVYVFRFCRQRTDPAAKACAPCGAGIDERAVVSRSGWQAQPPIRDMARILMYPSGEGCCSDSTTVPNPNPSAHSH